MRRKETKGLLILGMAVALLLPAVFAFGQPEVSKKTETSAPKSELDNLKTEWEEVREQQIRMIREKEDQLEKLKEEIFSRMKTQGGVAVSGGSSEVEAPKAALKAERQKFFAEMDRQKESLRKLQAALDDKARQLEAERERFEQEKKKVVR